jgi:hypothetical protein
VNDEAETFHIQSNGKEEMSCLNFEQTKEK